MKRFGGQNSIRSVNKIIDAFASDIRGTRNIVWVVIIIIELIGQGLDNDMGMTYDV